MEKKLIIRTMAAKIEEVSSFFPVITITGPRQSGKTTLIKSLFGGLPYYSLEDLDTRNLALSDPRAFLNSSEQGMILDEVQNAPDLISYIQGIVDGDPQKRYVLSGSSQFSMLKSVTQSLAGRTAVFELLPLSYSEIRTEGEKKSLDELLLAGFYPTIYAGTNKPEYFYPNYVKTYLERDVRDLLFVKDLMQFQIFLRLCAARIGSLFNASELANEVGVSSNTIKSWLSVLQASYLVVILPPYFENSRKRLTKTPKIYFTDTGLAAYLLGIDTPEQLARDKMRGFLFENFIVMEALKHRYNCGKDNNLFFYRDSRNNEVDLLLRSGSSFAAIEIKSAQTFHPDFQKGLKVFASEYADRISEKAIVYAGALESDGEYKLVNYNHFETLLKG